MHPHHLPPSQQEFCQWHLGSGSAITATGLYKIRTCFPFHQTLVWFEPWTHLILVFRGHTVPLAPTADARRLFAPTAGTQCLSRLRRTHGVFSCLRRPLRKQTAKSLLSAPYGKALQRQAKIFIQAKITVPPHVRNRRIKHSKSLTLGIPRVRDLLFIRKKTSLFFRCLVHDYAIVTVQWTHSVFSRLRRAHSAFRAYGVPYGSKPQRVCFLLHIGSPKETLSQSSRHNA